MVRVLETNRSETLKEIMRQIKVDPWGIKIMLPKAGFRLVRTGPVSNIAANILKQEMLSIGAEVAVARGALTGGCKKTDCLLIGSLAHYSELCKKLSVQPFGLKELGSQISLALEDFDREEFIIKVGRKSLVLKKGQVAIMGILNMTPDSFSGDGFSTLGLDEAISHAEKMAQEGADIIDVGGESSRPGAKKISLKEELKRVIPIIKLLAKRTKVPISIDTVRPEAAQQALDSGASIVNDITGLKDRKMRRLVASYRAAAVIMHMQGRPPDMQRDPRYSALIRQITEFFQEAIARCRQDGIGPGQIIIDPGIGFGKTLEHNLEILGHLGEFRSLGKPILVGTSRKSFIGKIIAAGPSARLSGTIASCLAAVACGAKILRVHDVAEVKKALKVFEAIRQ